MAAKKRNRKQEAMVDPKPVPVPLEKESGLSNQEQSLDWTFIS